MHFKNVLFAIAATSSFANASLSGEEPVARRAVAQRSGGPGPSGGSGGNDGGKRSGGGGNCPAIWSEIVPVLTASYVNETTGQCTAFARQAIRAAFHDCGAWNTSLGEVGGCDGSLILAREVFDRPENNGMQNVSNFLIGVSAQFPTVSMADLIQFSASVAITSCPLGPQVQTFVGRNDSSVPAPMGLLPDPNTQSADFLKALFAAKGIDAAALAALLGAHTTSQQFFANVSHAGEFQDDTPGIWDVDFYADTNNPPAGVFRFHSDIVLSQDVDVGPQFQGFVGNQGKWNGKFAKAMTALSLLGVPGGSSKLIDCTNVIPQSTQNLQNVANVTLAEAT